MDIKNKKEIILDMYINQGKSSIEIAATLNMSKQGVLKHLNKCSEYKDKILSSKEETKKKEQKILNLYYIDKYKPTEIAKQEGVSKSFVTQVLKNSPDYVEEKEKRKKQNIIVPQSEIDYQLVKRQHETDAKLLSEQKKITKISLLKQNIRYYNYISEKRLFIFDEKYGKCPADLPSRYRVPKEY